MRRALRVIAVLLGVALIVGARYTMAYPDAAGAVASDLWEGPSMSSSPGIR